MNRENIQRMLPALGLYPFVHRHHMEKARFDDLITHAQQEAANHSFKAYFPLCVIPLNILLVCVSDIHTGTSASVESLDYTTGSVSYLPL